MLEQVLLILTLVAAEANPGTVIQGTAAARSEHLAIQTGGLVVRPREPGIAFGLIQIARLRPQLTYFLIFKHRIGTEITVESSEDAIAEGNSAWSRHSISTDGKGMLIEYHAQADPRTRKLTQQTLTLFKKPLDLTRGRVVLVDLTSTPPRWEQRKVDLPTELGEALTRPAADALARKVLATLVKEDRRIREFVEACRSPSPDK